MTILAIDTTSESGSLALRRPGQTVAEVAMESSEGFGHLLFREIEKLLAQAQVRLEGVDCFAAANGPGSFTGVRVGLTAAKGLAEALGKQAIGVSNLQALASFGKTARRAVLLDARRGEVYAAVYGADLQLLEPEVVTGLGQWLAALPEGDYEFISPLDANVMAGTRFAGMPFGHPPKQLAAAIAACAETIGGTDPALLDANYVRRSDAELFWKEA